MTSHPRKMSEIMKEMAETILRNPGVVPSSEAMHVALMFTNFAWNECVGLEHNREDYRPAWEMIEAENPALWNEFKSSDPNTLMDDLVTYKNVHFSHDGRRVLVCGMLNGKVHVEWLNAAAPGVDSKSEMSLYTLVRTDEREKAIGFLQKTQGISRKEAIKQVREIASQFGTK